MSPLVITDLARANAPRIVVLQFCPRCLVAFAKASSSGQILRTEPSRMRLAIATGLSALRTPLHCALPVPLLALCPYLLSVGLRRPLGTNSPQRSSVQEGSLRIRCKQEGSLRIRCKVMSFARDIQAHPAPSC